MKFSTREDIEAPLQAVFDAFADTGGWERALLRRGADVSRTDHMETFGVGMSWLIAFSWRGRRRKMTLQLVEAEMPHQLVFDATGNSVTARVILDFMQMSASRSRVSLSVIVKPRNIAARLFLQSLKLAKTRINERFKTTFSALCADLETRMVPGPGAPRR